METKSLVPVADIQAVARNVVQSRLFPAFKDEPTALVLMLLAQAEGVLPIQAVQRYDVIQGRPAKKAAAMLSDFLTAGGRIEYGRDDDECVEITFHSPTLAKPHKVSWTMEQAKAAGLTGKENWHKYPNAMLNARCISSGIRKVMPAIVSGIYTPEETEDFTARPSAPIVEPEQPKARVTIECVPVAETAAAVAPKPSTSEQRRELLARLKRAGLATKDQVLEWATAHCGREIAATAGIWHDEMESLLAKAADMIVEQTRAKLDAERASEPAPEWMGGDAPTTRESGEEG